MTHRDLVTLVHRRMRELNLTPYQLHGTLRGKVSKQTVYNFVEHGRIVRSNKLIAIMNALGLTFTRARKR